METPQTPEVAAVIRALGKRKFEEVEALFIASTCVVALGRGLHPSELVECLADSISEAGWEGIKEDIFFDRFREELAS